MTLLYHKYKHMSRQLHASSTYIIPSYFIMQQLGVVLIISQYSGPRHQLLVAPVFLVRLHLQGVSHKQWGTGLNLQP